MNNKYYAIVYPDNFPLSEIVFGQIAFKLLCNLNISARGAQLILADNKLWSKTSIFFDKIDSDIAEIATEDELKRLVNELQFLKWTVSGCKCESDHKIFFKLKSWITTFGTLTPYDLKCFADAHKLECPILQRAQLNHILSTADRDKTLKYLSEWWDKISMEDLNLLLDTINQKTKAGGPRVKTVNKYENKI